MTFEDPLPEADWPAATRLILQHARHLYEQGRGRTLLDWITSLPSGILEAAPWLAYWSGACQVWVNPPTARRQLEQAFDRFVLLGDRNGQVLAAGAMSRACIARCAHRRRAATRVSRTVRSDAGRSVITRATMACTVLPVKGASPASISYVTAPSA